MDLEPFPDDPAAALAEIADIARARQLSYLVARVEGAFFAIDPSLPREILVLRFSELIPAEVQLDIRSLAQWLVLVDGSVREIG